MAGGYTPQRGDFVWLHFDPRVGHEQAGHRPALVVSPGSYNSRVGLALFCPVTSRVKGYPFEVLVPEGSEVAGAVLADQLKSLDWRARNVQLIHPAPEPLVAEVLARILPLLSPT